VSEPRDGDEPTDEDVAAIAAILFTEQSEPIQEMPKPSPWLIAARREAVETWEQPTGLSRLQDTRDR
jgi:hypothetical protein